MTRRVIALVVAALVGAISFSIAGVAPAYAVDEPPPLEERVFGTSVQGQPLVAYRYGTPGGVVVMVVGVIHGDE